MRGGLGSRPIRHHHHHHHHKFASFLLFPEWDLPLGCRAISAIARAPCVFSPTLLFFFLLLLLFPFAIQIESPLPTCGAAGAIWEGEPSIPAAGTPIRPLNCVLGSMRA